MKRIVAFTGAGISKASGVPTFEELPGIRDYLTRDYFLREPEEFYEKLWQLYLRIQQGKPNSAHLALAQYEIPVVTMNVDGFHRKAGTCNLVEIHGNMDLVFCPDCNTKESFAVIEKRIVCSNCERILEPNIILYGDEIKEFSRAMNLIEHAELLLVIGTSFYTSTASYVTEYARSKGCQVEIINQAAEFKVPDFLKENVS